MNRLVKIAALVLTMVLMAAVAGCTSGPTPTSALRAGSPAPDFVLKNLEGQDVTLSGLRGRPVMLNFWATWCGPCRHEMPFLQQVFEDEAWAERGLVILAVNLGESPASVMGFVEDNGLTFPVLLDARQSVAQDYNIRSIPTTFFISGDGIIKGWQIGSFTDKAEIDRNLTNSILKDTE
jgi:peroxiredoxin